MGDEEAADERAPLGGGQSRHAFNIGEDHSHVKLAIPRFWRSESAVSQCLASSLSFRDSW